MESAKRLQSLLIAGMAVSLVGSEMVRLYAHQPEYFEYQGIGMIAWYGLSAFVGMVLALGVKGLGRTSARFTSSPDWLLAALFVFYLHIRCSVALGRKLEGGSVQGVLLGGIAVAVTGLLVAAPGRLRRNFIHAACFMAVFASVTYDLIDWATLATAGARNFPAQGKAHRAAPARPSRNFHVFELLLDGMPGYDYVYNPVLRREAFFRDLSSGIFFPNTYANGHKTEISTAQMFSGQFEDGGAKSDTLFDQLLRHGYQVNVFSEYERSCGSIPASTCLDRAWAIESGMFKGRRWQHLLFRMEQLLHAYFLRINLPGLSEKISFSEMLARDDGVRRRFTRSMRKSGVSSSLILFQEFVKRLDSLRGPSYNLLHIVIPHPPNIHDQDCDVTGSAARPMPDASGILLDASFQQVLCANKLARILITELQRRGLYESSLIVIHSDHGNGWGYLNFLPGSEHFGEEKHLPRDEIIERSGRALLWIKPPGFRRKEIRERRALLLDLSPTLSSMIGLQWRPHDGMDLFGTALVSGREVFARNQYPGGSYFLKRLESGRWLETSREEAVAAANRRFVPETAPATAAPHPEAAPKGPHPSPRRFR